VNGGSATPGGQPSALAAVSDRLLSAGVNVVGAAVAIGVAAALTSAFTSDQVQLASVVLGLATLLLLLVVAPDQGLLLWVVLAPFHRFFNLDMGSGLPNLGLHRIVALSLLLLLMAQRAANRRRLLRFTAIEVLSGLFALGMLLSVPASRLGIVGGIQNVFDFVVLPLLWFYFARNLLGSKQGLARLAIAIAIAGAAMGLIAAREQLTLQTVLSPNLFHQAYGRYSVKVNSLFGSAAIMSMTLAVTVAVTFLGAVRARKLGSRLAWSAALVAILAGLLLTYVRGGWAAALPSLLVPALLSRRAQRYALYVAPLFLILALIVTYGGVDTRAIEERLQSQKPIDYRVDAIEIGLQIAVQSPVFGLGLDNYGEAALAAGWRPVSGAVLQPVDHPHNMFIYVLTSAGLVGLLPLLALLGLIGWRALGLLRTNRDRDWPAAVLGLLMGYGVLAVSFDAYRAQLGNMYFFMIVGAVFGAYEAQNDRAFVSEAVS